MKRLCAALIAWGCLTTTVWAVPILDQEHNPATNLAAFQSAGVMAQTFTVGIAGNLVEVQVMISSSFNTDNLDFKITGTSAGSPNLADVRYSAVLLESTLPNADGVFYSVPIGGAVPVSVGDVLAIVIDDPGDDSGFGPQWRGEDLPGSYAGGQFFFLPGSATGHDAAFRAFVESASVVPEPGTIILLGSGLAGLAGFGSLMRRRRRETA
jgi:hypothetical protein